MKRLLRTSMAVVLGLIAAPALLGAAPASPGHDHHARVVYDALGDSYASGFGVPPYSACGRSQDAYPELLNGRQHLQLDDFVACAGATTTTVVSGGQLTALDSHTGLVTLTVGGNDIGWSTAVGACLAGTDAQCAGALALVEGRAATQLPALLATLYGDVAAAAPDAHVVVTGYPRLFSPEYGAYYAASPAEQVALNAGADLLDSVIHAATARAGFQYVDVRKRFAGHGANSPDPWIHGPTDPAAFHPNLPGYEAYAAAVNSALGPVRLR